MIKIYDNPPSFELLTRHSAYFLRVAPDGKLQHCFWGVRPAGSESRPLAAALKLDSNFAPQDDQTEQLEVKSFGELIYHGIGLKLNYQYPDGTEIRDCRLRFVSAEIRTNASPGLAPTHGIPPRNCEERETLVIHMADPVYPLQASLYYRVTESLDIIERWIELENSSDEVTIAVEKLCFASVTFPAGTTELTSLSGRWGHEFNATRTEVPVGTTLLESHGLNTSADTNPVFLLNRPRQAWEQIGTVYFGALAYSGNHQLEFERQSGGPVHLHAGYNPLDFELVLKPRMTHSTPQMILGCCPDGWSGASRRLHGLIRDFIQAAPPAQDFLRPVLYNSWEATGFNVQLSEQMRLAEKAAAIGIELFCMDDGWHGARRSDKAGLGDWFPTPELFPEGLKPLSDHIHRLGMKFGLWVEPEMVNADSDLFRAHPEWVLQVSGRPLRESRNQLILDFGREEAAEYIFRRLDALVDEAGVDFFKWDMNRRPSENGSVAGRALWQRHVERLYSIMDRLRAGHPHLAIQSCSSGGARVDAGILGRVDQVWTSDNTDAMDRMLIQEGCSLAYPARVMECWVTDEVNLQTGRSWPVDMRFDAAMRGTLGIGTDLNKMSEEELGLFATRIAFYKRIRPVVQTGNLYRLVRSEEHGSSIIEYVLPDGSEAVVSIIRGWCRISNFLAPVPLSGLELKADYAIFDRQGNELDIRSGYELATRGIEVNSFYENRDHTMSVFSATYHLKRQ